MSARIVAALAIVLIGAAGPVVAEEGASALDGFLPALELTEQEAAELRPVYLEYEAAMADVGERVKLLLAAAMDDKKQSYYVVEQSIDDHVNLLREKAAVRKRFIKSFRKILSPRKVLLLLELEELAAARERCSMLERN